MIMVRSNLKHCQEQSNNLELALQKQQEDNKNIITIISYLENNAKHSQTTNLHGKKEMEYLSLFQDIAPYACLILALADSKANQTDSQCIGMLACACYQASKFKLRRNKTATAIVLLNATNILL